MSDFTLEDAREILAEMGGEHLYSEEELDALVTEANNHPTRSAESFFIDSVSEQLREGAFETAEAEAMGDSDAPRRGTVLLVNGLDELERLG